MSNLRSILHALGLLAMATVLVCYPALAEGGHADAHGDHTHATDSADQHAADPVEEVKTDSADHKDSSDSHAADHAHGDHQHSPGENTDSSDHDARADSDEGAHGTRTDKSQRDLKTDDKEHLDAVLLMDASGSMRLTDPDRLRDEGARLFLQFLKKGDRLAVVEFAEEAKVIRPLSFYDKAQDKKVEQEIARVGNSGMFTDVNRGVEKARELLDASVRDNAEQIIILLSDGKHDPDPKFGSPIQSLDNLMFGQLPDLKAAGVRVYTLAFSDQVDKDLLNEVSVSTDALSWHTPRADDIHQSFADLFLAVKKPQILPLTSRGVKIDSDIKEATFYINNEEGGEELSIMDPEGNIIKRDDTIEGVRWFVGKKFNVVTIEKPKVGTWKIVGLPSKESFATVLTDLKLVTDWGGNIVAGTPTLLQARLYESEKPVVLPEMSGVTRFLYQVVPTDRVSEPILKGMLHDDSKHGDKIARDGIFSVNIDIDTPGEYKLKVLARSPTFERSQQLPFRVKERLISVSVISVADSLGGHADGHGKGHEDDHGDGHGDDHGKPAGGTTKEYFRVKLSPEVATFKSVDVKLIATDASRKRYHLPIKQASDKSLRYEVPVAVLQHEGEYELLATLAAQDRKRNKISGSSKTLHYKRVIGEIDEHQEEVSLVVVEEEEPEEEKEQPLFLSCLIIILINGVVGGVFIFNLKKSQTQMSFVVPKYEPSEELTAQMTLLEERANAEEVDFEDPRFDPDAESTPAPVFDAPDGATESAAPEGATESTTPEGEEGAEATDDTADDDQTEAEEVAAEAESEEVEAAADEQAESGEDAAEESDDSEEDEEKEE